ncbi:MAG: methionine biosynthesis protein MetW [Sphingomonadales bacterium]
MIAAETQALRADLGLIADLVAPNMRVLDVGCGDGALLAHLAASKAIDARGIELDQNNVHAAVARGLSVVQGNADTDLINYPSDGFDMAILSQTLQATQRPKTVLANLARIAPKVAVSIPNFGHWAIRLRLLATGRMPSTPVLPMHWYDTPNIHLCTLRDFAALAADLDLDIAAMFTLNRDGEGRRRNPARLAWINWSSEIGVFLLQRRR